MTFKKLFSTLLVLWVILAVIKYGFFSGLNMDSLGIKILFGALVFGFSEALTRRLGVLNFLEAMLVSGFYTLTFLLLDLLILGSLLGNGFFTKSMYWIGYGLMIISIFFFHKKRHVEIRKQQAHHHGHH